MSSKVRCRLLCRPPLKPILPFLLVLVGACLLTGITHAAIKPNIVILLADDSGWGDYSFTGNTQVRTPNIDSIARAGASLDRFYVCAVCSPTRAEFLTGRYHPRTGVRGVSTGQERMNTDEKTLADAFQAAGYATGCFGKWHNGSQWPYHPNARGFDEYYGFTSGHWGEYFDPPLEHNGRPVRGRGYSSYFVHWTSLGDTMTWDIEVMTSGTYDVEILDTCPVADAGSTIELEFNGAKLAGRVGPGWDPPLYTNQDTIPRPVVESQMKEFRPLAFGPMRLEKGRGPLTLRALKIPGQHVMDVRQLNLTLRK